eukprot:5611349-Alexandrium_andersonii.AAC.1
MTTRPALPRPEQRTSRHHLHRHARRRAGARGPGLQAPSRRIRQPRRGFAPPALRSTPRRRKPRGLRRRPSTPSLARGL